MKTAVKVMAASVVATAVGVPVLGMAQGVNPKDPDDVAYEMMYVLEDDVFEALCEALGPGDMMMVPVVAQNGEYSSAEELFDVPTVELPDQMVEGWRAMWGSEGMCQERYVEGIGGTPDPSIPSM